MKYTRGTNPKSHLHEQGQPATCSPTTNDLAWAAGLFEGEGHIQYGKAVQVTVSQCDKWVIDKFLSFFGGKVYAVSPRGFSKKVSHRWYVGGARARGIILTLYSFFSPRLQARVQEALA